MRISTSDGDGASLRSTIGREARAAGFDAVAFTTPDAIPLAAGRLREFVETGCHGSMEWMAETLEASPNLALAGATPYLRLFGIAVGGHYLANAALRGLDEGGPHAMQSVALARFFAENISVAGQGLAAVVTSGGHAVLEALPEAAPA